MGGLAKYAFINAKVRTRLSKLLNDSIIDSLINCEDMDSFSEILQPSVYGPLFKDKNIFSDTSLLELALVKRNISEYKEILHQLGRSNTYNLIRLMMEKYEVENLKAILRVWQKGDAAQRKYLIEETISRPLNIEGILQADTIDTVLAVLKGTVYYKPLMAGLDSFKSKNSLFYLEIALDKDYYLRLKRAISALDLQDLNIAGKLLGLEIDIQNINWLFRFKKYYKLPAGEIINYLIPFGYKLKASHLHNASQQDNIRDILSSLNLTETLKLPQDIISSAKEDSFIELFEAALVSLAKEQALVALTNFPFSICIMMAYFMLRRIETKNLISLINAKLHNYNKQEIKRVII